MSGLLNVRVVCSPVLLAAPKYVAQVIWPETIHVKRGARVSETLIAHELGHVLQVRRMGIARYWLAYLSGLIRHGHKNHPMELEATELARQPDVRSAALRLLTTARVRCGTTT